MELENAVLRDMEDEYEISGETRKIVKPALVSSVPNPYTDEFDFLFIDDIPEIKEKPLKIGFVNLVTPENAFDESIKVKHVSEYNFETRFRYDEEKEAVVNEIFCNDINGGEPIYSEYNDPQAFINAYVSSVYAGDTVTIYNPRNKLSEINQYMFINHQSIPVMAYNIDTAGVIMANNYNIAFAKSVTFSDSATCIALQDCDINMDINCKNDYDCIVNCNGYKFVFTIKFPNNIDANRRGADYTASVTQISIIEDADTKAIITTGDEGEEELSEYKEELLKNSKKQTEQEKSFDDLFDDIF